jgi:hypothetical protein
MIAEGGSTETIEACAGIEIWWSTPAVVYADCLDIATTMARSSLSIVRGMIIR